MLAIIPARGGSKGLPGKNIKELSGKPLIAYTIEAALKSSAISSIVVSTDDPKIAEVAKLFGAEVPFMRPDFLATDEARAIDAYLYTINRLEKEKNTSYAELIVLLPTCPLRVTDDIDDAIALFRSNNADSVISYTEEHHPISWHRKIAPDGRIVSESQGDLLKNRQDFQKTYYPNGAIYVFKKSVLLTGNYYTENSFAYKMPRYKSVDIDTQEDFELAEFYLNKYGAKINSHS